MILGRNKYVWGHLLGIIFLLFLCSFAPVGALNIDGSVKDEFDNDTLVAWYNNTHRHDSYVDIVHDPLIETPDDILNVTGINDGGNLASVQAVDGDLYNVSEVVGNPGFNIKFNITGLVETYTNVHLNLYVWYSGGAKHDVFVQVWNYSSSSWVDCGIITEGVALDWFNFTHIGVASHFISGGIFIGRLYHDDPGNINHDIYIDYIELNLDACPCGQVWSENMFVNRNSTLIVQFRYNVTIPTAGMAFAKVSFSRDNSTWYASSGLSIWDTMTTGDNTILLTGLDWAGNFYYRVWMMKDINGTSPTLDMIQISYQAVPSGSSWNVIIVITVILSLLGIGILFGGRRR